MALGEEDVYCTLVMSDSYLPGAAVLAHSLRDNGTKHKLACLVTLDTIRPTTFTELKALFDYVIPVDRIGNPNPANLYLMNRGDLLYAFTKIGLWRQTQFRRIVYIDADVVTLRAPDELFDLPHSFAAAPDVGWPDIFNTGVMVLSPNMGEYWALRTLASSGDSFDGADQGLLNQFYEHKDWHRLSFTYNCTPSANYQYEPAYRYYKSRISMVHFIGKTKPWMTTRSKNAVPGAFNELLNRWWAVYDTHYQVPAMDYISGRYAPASKGLEHVAHPDSSGTINAETEPLVTTTEPDLAETIDLSEELTKRTVHEGEQRGFEAPRMEWDATRSAPPSDARPEAGNFSHETYAFNEDKGLFKAPKHYPEPPKDMWYELPKEKPAYIEARPPPIFPWEQREISKPTRVFADDIESPIHTPVNETFDMESSLPPTPIIKITAEQPIAEFESSNAWDQEPGIDRYIRALHKRNKSSRSENEATESSTAFERRESLFHRHGASDIDRPSLPVTPAPIRRAFWGEERDAAGKLPSAEGVPDQADWNPSEKLEELRRHSLILTQSDLQTSKTIPNREMMPTAVEIPNASSPAKEEPPKNVPTASTSGVAAPRPIRAPRVQFGEVAFAGVANDGEREKVLRPSQGGPEDEDAFLEE